MAPLIPEKFSPEAGGYLPPVEADTPGVPDATLADALVTVRKRKYLIGVIALAGMIYGLYKGSTQPRLYEAHGRIEIRSGSSNQYRVGGGFTDYGMGRIPTEVTILTSDTLLFNVAQDLDLPNNPDFLGLKQRPPRANTDDPAVREGIIAHMQGIVTITALSKTDLLNISARTPNPKLSADIVNKVIDEYITRSVSSRVDATKRASTFLTGQLDELKHQVETSQEQVLDLQKRLGVLAIDPGHNQIGAALESLTTASSDAEIARILAESRYHVLSTMAPTTVDQTVANTGNVAASQLSNLRGQREVLLANLAKLTAPGNLGPKHPEVEAIRAQIEELTKQIQEEQDRVIAQAKQTYIAARANEDQTRAALEAEKTEADKLRDDLVKYTIRQRDFDSNRNLYEGLRDRLRTAAVQAGLESTEIDIIDQAMPPSSPSLAPRSSFVIVDTVVGLILGLVLAFLLESLDTGLSSVSEIESVSGLPSLALIPRSRRAGVDVSTLTAAQRNLGTLTSPKSQFTEAFRALRTSLLLSTAGKLPQVILLTSATPSEGKTTISTNLACVLAQNNVRVLMIDADLRRPTVHHRLGLNGKVGLTSVLTGSVPLEQAVQRLPEIPNLDVLVSGPVPPFPTEMLGSATMTRLLEQCRGIYSHIVIDSPPLLSVTDGVVLARDADTVVLIVRHGKSGKQTVRRARDLLLRSGAPVTGIAINAVDLNSPEYYGYYGYSVYSGYSSAGVDATAWESQSGPENTGKGDKR